MIPLLLLQTPLRLPLTCTLTAHACCLKWTPARTVPFFIILLFTFVYVHNEPCDRTYAKKPNLSFNCFIRKGFALRGTQTVLSFHSLVVLYGTIYDTSGGVEPGGGAKFECCVYKLHEQILLAPPFRKPHYASPQVCIPTNASARHSSVLLLLLVLIKQIHNKNWDLQKIILTLSVHYFCIPVTDRQFVCGSAYDF